MSYVNCGAYVTAGMERVKTKKQLRELMAADPSSVTFDRTSAYESGFIAGGSLPRGDVLIVVGPNPYNDRKWYANVFQHPANGVKVS